MDHKEQLGQMLKDLAAGNDESAEKIIRDYLISKTRSIMQGQQEQAPEAPVQPE